MSNLRLCTYEYRGTLNAGFFQDAGVLPLRDAYALLDGAPEAPATLLDFLGGYPQNLAPVEVLAQQFGKGDPGLLRIALPFNQVRLKAPLLYPGKIYCAGANYFDHAKEMGDPNWDKVDENVEPYFFSKPADNTVIGTRDSIEIPRQSQALDWEVELGVIIGRRCKRISPDQAADCIAGYTIFVDMTARDLSRRPNHIFKNDWVSGKCFDGASPMGPCVLLKRPGEQIRHFGMRLLVNDRIRQNSTTEQMIIGVNKQVSWLSQAITLNPGDVVATGTPAGVGYPKKEFLKAGDIIRAEIDDIGTLVNPIVAADRP